MITNQQLSEHRFLGITQSLCPACLTVVSAKILSRHGRIYFRKHCPHHGMREDFVCGDEAWFDRLEYTVPARIPPFRAIEPRLGCPFDCGLCLEHEQHTCVGVLEITDNCNLTCPMCYAESAPGRKHLPYDACRDAIDHFVRAEGRPEVLQLSGGEPTTHPDFERILAYACQQPIDVVMINTNGIRIAKDAVLREFISQFRGRCQVYLQFDGLTENLYKTLRGEELLEQKHRTVEQLGAMQVFTTLVCTVSTEESLSQIGDLIRFGVDRPWVAGISFQPATYVGRFVSPEDLERRITFPEVIQAAADQSHGVWRPHDFLPIPCAHPNAHTVAYAYRHNQNITPLTRFMEVDKHLDLLANGISFTRDQARRLIQEFVSRESCGEGCDCAPTVQNIEIPDRTGPPSDPSTAQQFFQRALNKDLSSADVFRITTTSFMDAYNFDIRQLMKSCVHHILPSGHIIPFCAYNNLYRHGHVSLPPLTREEVVDFVEPSK